MSITSRRTLLQALIFSVLVHAVLLLSVAALVPVRLEAPVATIRVVMNRESKVIAKAPNFPNTPVSKPVPMPAKPTSAPARPPVEQKLAVSEPSSLSAVTVPAVPVTPPSARESAPPAAMPSSAGPGAGTSVPSSVPVREGVNADDLRQYRVSLATAAKRFKRYPPLARERGWEGTVEIALDFNALLPGPEIVLAHSSGKSLLDEQAVEMMTQASRVTSMPEGLKGRAFRVLLPVQFSLDGG